MKKKILYFIPDNPMVGKAGNKTRSLKILEHLSEIQEDIAEIEFLTVADWGEWQHENIQLFYKKFPKFKLYSFNRKIPKKKFIKRLLLYKIPNLLSSIFLAPEIDITNIYFRWEVKKYLRKAKHDIIIGSYSSWAKLFIDLKHNPYLILDTHDFITAQKKKYKNHIGKLFQSELDIIRKYDEIWTLSIEEKYIYEQFTESKIFYVPMSFELKELQNNHTHTYDIVYVASENPHNIESIHWFLHYVLPKINKNYTVHIFGKICETITVDYPNVVKHGIVDDLDEVYQYTRITICPMLSGTGVKIKVLESLSNNLPVVTTIRGVDGLMNKTNNGCWVAENADQFADMINQLMENNTDYNKSRIEANEYFTINHSIEKEKELYLSVPFRAK